MFIHHVFFWMTSDATADDRAHLLSGLQALTTIEHILQSHIGVPADTDRPVIERSYAFSLLLLFDTPADEAGYQTHPIHLGFIKNCSHLWTKVVVYDSVDAL